MLDLLLSVTGLKVCSWGNVIQMATQFQSLSDIIISQVVDSGIHKEEDQAMCLSETGWHYGG
jgi:hypothetical protein